MGSHWKWQHINYAPDDWAWRDSSRHRDLSWHRDSSWDWTDGDSWLFDSPAPAPKPCKISTLGMKHPLPLEGRQKILLEVFKVACSRNQVSFPTLYIQTWNARVVQAVIFILCRLEPSYPANLFLDEENKVNVKDGAQSILGGFFACYRTEQEQEQIIKFFARNAIQGHDAIIDEACRQGFDPLQVEDKVSGSGAKCESRHAFAHTSRPFASPQGPSKTQDLHEDILLMEKEKQNIDMRISMLKTRQDLERAKAQYNMTQQHVPEATTAPSMTGASLSFAEIQEAMIGALIKFKKDLQENPTSKQAVSQLQTQPEADLGNDKEAQAQHKGQQEATSREVATTVVDKLPEAQAPLVVQENRTPNQAVTELQKQAEATTLMVAQTDEAQAQAKGQQQETQATSLTATLFGASDNGDDTSDPNSDDNKEGHPFKKMRTQ